MNPHRVSWPAAALTAAFLLLTGAAVAYSQSRVPVNVSQLGPQVGQRVPDFNLKDQNGTAWSLESIMGPKGAMLVFFRSADW